MEVTVTLVDGTEFTKEVNVDPMGVTYEKESSSIILPGEEAPSITLVLIPWSNINKIEYTISPSDVEAAGLEQAPQNRKQRRAALQV